MKSTCELSSLAEADVRAIWKYIAQDNARAADRLADAFHRRFTMLAMQPLLGEQCDELATGLRRFVIGNYVAYYVITDDQVIIARVLHGAQDLDRIEWN